MYTICPGCERQFRIYAEHIAAASGQVRCGFCQQQFSALDRLYDEPQAVEKDVDDQDEPQFEIPAIKESRQEDIAPSKPEAIDKLNDAELDLAVKEITNDYDDEISESENDEEEFDALLLSEEKKPGNRLLTTFWAFSSLVAIVALAAQLSWFNRDWLIQNYPEVLPYAKQLCDKYGCELNRLRNTNKITLINRDVRLHPRFEDALLVNATMKNELDVHQPYPKVQFTLFDTSGTLIGYRNFLPSEYLDDSININEGMPINAPVHFVLEVSGPTAGAVSFEFRFL